jgi:hypothetical protein
MDDQDLHLNKPTEDDIGSVFEIETYSFGPIVVLNPENGERKPIYKSFIFILLDNMTTILEDQGLTRWFKIMLPKEKIIYFLKEGDMKLKAIKKL